MTAGLALGLAEYAEGVRSGSVSAEEHMASTLERIARHDGALHAYVSLDPGALEGAARVDRDARAGRDVGPLAGAPLAVKDNICALGGPTTCCSRMLGSYRSPYDATAVSRLRGAGAIVVGKTNMDEFAMGITTEFSAFGPSRNPWDTARVPGGSSGGSAVAVSALECAAALGSDTGGSVRNPASFCSIVGLKPTYGRVSRHGLVSYANSIEQIGPMARSVRDAAMLMDAIAGPDPMDDTTRLAGPAGGHAAHLRDGVEGLTVGVDARAVDESTPVGRAARRAAGALESLGASVVDVDLAHEGLSVAAYYVITAAEAGSNLARYDNIRYGYEMPADGYEHGAYVTAARSRLGPEVQRRMILGGFVPSAGHAGQYYLKALRARDVLASEADSSFSSLGLSCLLSPTVPVPPFRLGEKIDDPVELFRMDSNTVLANLTGRPAVSVPFTLCGGLPVGMQLMGRAGEDARLLGVAAALEGAADEMGVPVP